MQVRSKRNKTGRFSVTESHSTVVDRPDVSRVYIAGLPIAVIDNAESARMMVSHAVTRRGRRVSPLTITSANGQVLSMCAGDSDVRALFDAFDIVHADGMPMVFASRLRCARALPERVATTDLFHYVAREAEQTGASFYLLGGTSDTMAKAASNVSRQYPKLALAGYHHGYLDAAAEARVVSEINDIAPDILWVGMGVPLEQEFVLRNASKLTNVGVIKTSGGLFDFLSGKASRAPGWMQRAGLEWLHRLALDPRRLLRRYLTTNPHALYLLLTQTRDEARPRS
jgi:N-acetylglucosaminyldiphosphoundecaprenol N-acetyl-beta-D-mannosaminyltransferase